MVFNLQSMIRIHLLPGKEQSLKRFHPWVFSGALKKTGDQIAEGEVVAVYSSDNEFLGIGHYQIGSIAVRILSFCETTIDQSFWNRKIRQAWQLRQAIGLADDRQTTVFRLVHGEGDGLPGLVIDYYNGTAVIQLHSVGMYHARHQIVQALTEVLGNRLKAVYNKSSKTLPFKAGLELRDEYLLGDTQPGDVLEYGHRFSIDWIEGQKTGFFIDQRENRKLLETYSTGRDVLNMFCYTGGFSVSALHGGARLVHSVDSSEKAIALTRDNIDRNFGHDQRHEAFASDAFEFMRDIKDRYDLIVLDPPAFAKHRDALPKALQAYKRINTRAFEQIRPGGILFTFSCSQVVGKDRFREAVFSAAAIARREVSILHQLSQPADHPVNIFHPEGEYLKGLVLFVE